MIPWAGVFKIRIQDSECSSQGACPKVTEDRSLQFYCKYYKFYNYENVGESWNVVGLEFVGNASGGIRAIDE